MNSATLSNMKLIFSPLLLLLPGILIFTSCKEDVDLESLKKPDYEGKWQVPVAKTHLTINELISEVKDDIDVNYIYDESTKTFSIIYRDSISGTVPEDYYKLDNRSFGANISIPEDQVPPEYLPFYNIGVVPPGTNSYTFNTTFTTSLDSITLDQDNQYITDASIDYIILYDGSLGLRIQNNFDHDVEIAITLNAIRESNGSPVEINNTLLPGETATPTVNLKDKELVFNNDGSNQNEFIADVSFTVNPVTGNSLSEDDHIDLNFSFNNLEYDLIVGQLGSYTIPMSRSEIDLGIFNNNEDIPTIHIENPKIKLAFWNSGGVPLELQIDELEFTGENVDDGTIEYVDPNPVQLNFIQSLAQRGDVVQTEYYIDKSNTSNLGDIINLAPNQLSYDISLDVQGQSNQQYFLARDSELGVVAEGQLPLHGSVGEYIYKDTLEAEFDFGISENGDTIVQEAELKLITFNGLPFDIGAQLYFLDENHTVLDSLFEEGNKNIFKSSTVDEQGLRVSETAEVTKVILSKEKYGRISGTQHIVIRGRLISAQNGQVPVKILGDYGFRLNIGASATFNVDLNE